MAKKKINASAYDAIIHGRDQAPKTKAPSPLGVPLTAEEQERLSEIAAALGVKRHHVLQYAVRQFLKSWERGERPQLEEQKITRLKMD